MARFVDLYLSLQGRTSRRDYWLYWVLPSVVIVWVLESALNHGLLRHPGSIFVLIFYLFVITWPGIAVSVKRWHDIDVSGWWVLILFVPYVGWLIALIFNGFSRGTIGENRYGPDPIREFPDSHAKAL